MLPTLENETQIIIACKNGDISAFKQIYDCYGQPMLRTAIRLVGQQADAEDAVQITFVKLFRNIKKFNFKSKFSTWIFRIHLNVCFDWLRKRNRLQEQAMDKVNPNFQTKDGLRIDLEYAIDQLPEKIRACFVLFAVEGFKQTEIAEILDIQLGTVKANIFHARSRLKKLLNEYLIIKR